MDEKLFSKKIRYLYDQLGIKGKEFTKLFWDGDKKKFASRHTTVHKSWLGKGINQAKGFYFDDYKISTYKIGNEVAFTLGNFMDDSFLKFIERVDRYVEHTTQSLEQFDYKYIYYFDTSRNKISYVILNSLEKLSNFEYKIELVPLKFKNSRQFQSYTGTLKIIDGYFYISVKNSFEIINHIFILNRAYRYNDKVHGIKLGRSTLKGLPRANKELLTKEKLIQEEEREFYLIANESDYLISTEVLDDVFSGDTRKTYLDKLHKKIDDLESFIKKSNEILDNKFGIDTYLKKFHQINLSVHRHLEEEDFIFHKNSFIDYPLQIEESHIIGEKISYIDNHIESEKLVFMFHGLGLDHNDFREYIEKSDYHCIAPTLYGFNKNENIIDTLSYKTHCYLLALFIREKADEIGAKYVTLVGFSIGGDMIQDIVKEYSFIVQKVNAVIFLDCNINIHTCTISRRIASLEFESKENVLNTVNSFNQNIKDLKDWLQVQQYLIKVFSKFIDRLPILSFFSKEIIDRFRQDTKDGFECFTSHFKNTTKKINYVQYIFSNDHVNKKLINTMNFINLKNSILGDNYNESFIQLEKEYLHFDLLEYSNLKKYIDASFVVKRIEDD